MKSRDDADNSFRGIRVPGLMVRVMALCIVFAFFQSTDLAAVEYQGYLSPAQVDDPIVIYVDRDATGAQNGLSWHAAFKTTQEGIDAAAEAGSLDGYAEVWVAEGRYDEIRFGSMIGGQGQNLGSLMLLPGVAVYGGFDGTETYRENRDWFAHETIIDGAKSRGELPAYHVVVGAENSVLDGFTITGGNASLHFTDEESGGGMFNKSCSPIVANCTFLRNKASYGGGGGIANIKADPRIINCRFYGNDGDFHGGAISNDQSSPEIVNCLFIGNQADEGGAMLCREPAAPKVINCTFVANQAMAGGAMFLLQQMEVINSILWANRATTGAGDQVYDGGSMATFSCCSIEGGINGSGFKGNPVIDGGHNLAEDPRFVRMPDPGTDQKWGTPDDDYGDLRLTDDSTLIDKGNNAAVPADVTDDIACHLRIRGVAIDLGPYESGGALDLWAVDLLRGWDELPDGAAVEPGEAIRIRAHTLTPDPFLFIEAHFSNGDPPQVLELDDGGFAYEGIWHPAHVGLPPNGRIEISVCAVECNCPLDQCVTRWVTMTTETDKADLVGNDLSLPVPPRDWGGAMQVNFTVLNQGVVAAPATQARFYLSQDCIVVPGSDVLLGQIDIPALGATGLHTGKAVLCLPTALPEGFDVYGTYYIGMVVDALSEVMEDFEHNNMNRGLGIDFAIFTLGPDDTSGPMVADYVPRVTSVPFDHLDITFSEPIQWSTFSRADITLLDPQGREIVVSDPELLEGTQFRIHFATQTAYGDYQLLIGPWIEDLHGNPMNQNKNTENGEGDLDRFDTTVVLYDKEPPYVEMMTVQNEGVGSVGYIDLTFSEEIDPRTFTTDDIVILGYDSETQDQYYASQIEPLNDTQFRVYTRYKDGSQERPLDRIQAYDIRVGSELCDMWGNTMDQRVKGGSTRHYRKEFPVCSGFAAALNLLNTEQDVMTRIRTSIVNALHMEFPDVQLPDELGLKNLIGEVPLIAADLLSGAGRTAFFRITAGGAITGTLGFSFEAAGITPSLGAHLRRDIAKVEQGLVIEATQVGGTRMYKIALALTGEHSLLFPVVFSGEAEAFLEFPEDFSECTLGYTFSPAVGTYILAELASKVQLDFEVADIEAEFALLVEMEGYLEAPLTLSATLSPEAFIAAMDAQDLPSALNRYVVQCALSAWPGTNRVGNLCGLVGKAMGQANSWNLSTAFDLTGAAAMGSKAGLGGGFELPCETAEMGIEVAFSVSAGMRQSVNLFQKTVKIPLDYEPSESGAIFNGDFEQGLMTWISPSGRSEAVSDGSGGTMALLRGYVSELSRSIFVPANATNLSFNYAFSPNVSSSSLFLQLNGQTVWQASGGPAGPSVPVQVDVSAFSGQMYEVRFLFWNPEDANALVTIDDVSVQRSDVFDFSDSFDSAALNPSRWNWVTPVGGPTYSLILSPGSLRLMTPNTQVFDCWGQTDQMPRLTYEGITGNWSIETRLSIPMSLSGGAFDSGIFVRLSANDYLTHGFTFGGPWLSSARTGTGQFLPFFSVDTNAIELRITRRDDDYRFFYRRVGDTEWIQSYELMSISREPESVGLFTKTWQAINTQADFDYFQIVSCP